MGRYKLIFRYKLIQIAPFEIANVYDLYLENVGGLTSNVKKLVIRE